MKTDQQYSKSFSNIIPGLISIVLGLAAVIFSFMPAFAAYAIYPGIAGLIAAVFSLIAAKRPEFYRGVVIAGIIVSITGIVTAVSNNDDYEDKIQTEVSTEKEPVDSVRNKQTQNELDALEQSLKSLDSATTK